MTAIESENGLKSHQIRSNQRKAIEALISGSTTEQAAIYAGVQERTVYHWRTQDDFKAALQDAQNHALSSAVIGLSGASIDAVQVLRDIANDTEAPPSTRVSAAKAILDSVIRLKELYDLENRISKLEAMQS